MREIQPPQANDKLVIIGSCHQGRPPEKVLGVIMPGHTIKLLKCS